MGPDAIGDISMALVDLGDVRESVAIRLGAGSPESDAEPSMTADPEIGAKSLGASRDVGDVCSAFFSLSLASSPSTRFSRASSTSVFGPRFLGTASVKPMHHQSTTNVMMRNNRRGQD